MPSTHGHEVIQMIADAAKPFSRDGLVDEIGKKFGSDARFHTCSAENMTASELVTFLIERGKFSGDDTALDLDPSKVCNHEA